MSVALWFGIPALAAYATATLLLWRRLLCLRAGEMPEKKLALGIALLGVLLHTVSLASDICCLDGIDLGVLKALSLSALVSLALVIISSLRQPLENLALPVLLLTMLALTAQLGWPSAPRSLIGTQPALEVHILLSILAYSLFSLAALQAGVLASQHRALHQRRPQIFARILPPLEDMEILLFRLIGAGFVLLTLSLITGFMFLEDIFAQHIVHKTVLSLISWALFGSLLLGRAFLGWRGRTAVRWTLSGFGALLLAYFGSKIVLEWVLGIIR
ncbi:MAG: cytochrome c biogenesis protein CcsA [Gammaproteobacteria bacterium]|nr:cytochrome c biogenesis protein CcsA [Gammaproteobacteria bacterium]